ncbi:MAG TPA: DUF3106 domain-containing protein [Caldimonas sp.]|nr:DUF3106 domain-containing protein [Caldimonas sp.]
MNGPEHTSRRALLGAIGLLAAALGLVRFATHDDADPSRPGAPPPVADVAASAPAIDVAGAVPTVAVVQDPSWQRLSSAQRQALAPLEQVWPTLGEGARRRWLAIASKFPTKSPATQDRIHARMTQWSKLSSSQRAEARLRYLQTAKMDAPTKRQRWEVYKRTEPGQHQPMASASKKFDVVPPSSVRASPGATTTLMSQLLERTQTTDTGAH